MRRYKGFSIIYLLPMIALLMSVSAVFSYKLYKDKQIQPVVIEEMPDPSVTKTMPELQKRQQKPSSRYGAVQLSVKPTVSRTPEIGVQESVSSSIDLDDLLSQTDDAGENDLKALDASASAL